MDAQDKPKELQHFLDHVAIKRKQIKDYTDEIAPRGAFLTKVSLVSSIIASVLAGIPTAIGGSGLTALLGEAGEDLASWRIIGAAVTFFSCVAALATGIFRSDEIATRLAKAHRCDAQLEAIELDVECQQVPLKEAIVRFGQCISEVEFLPSYPTRPSRWRRLFGKYPMLDGVVGTINLNDGSVVPSNCIVTGTAAGLQPGLHLWLAVEVGASMWPKEGEVAVQADGTWTKSIFEEGDTDEFALSLYVLDSAADRLLRNWFKQSDREGHYRALHRTEMVSGGMLRLARVEHLHRVIDHHVGTPARKGQTTS